VSKTIEEQQKEVKKQTVEGVPTESDCSENVEAEKKPFDNESNARKIRRKTQNGQGKRRGGKKRARESLVNKQKCGGVEVGTQKGSRRRGR